MAKTVDILKYILGLDAKPFRREARRVDKSVRRLKRGVDKSAKSFGGLQTAVIGAAVALAALKFAGIIKSATLVAARIEVLDSVYRLVGKTAGITNVELEFTKQKLIALGIAEREAVRIGIRFIQVQLDLADSLKIARAAQDLAFVAGVNSSEAALTLTEAIVKGHPRLLRQFGIIINLADAWQTLSKRLGKTANELTSVEKRQFFLSEILKKAATVAGSYEKAMELVGKRLTSLPRHFQNAQKAVGQHFLPAMRVAVDGAAEFLQLITEGFRTAEQTFTTNLFKFAKGFDKFAASQPKIAALRNEFVELTKEERLTIPEQERLNAVIQELGDLLPEVRGILRGYKDDLEGATFALDGLIGASEAIQRFRLQALLLDQATAFDKNTAAIEEFATTATGGFGLVSINLKEAEQDLRIFGKALVELTAKYNQAQKALTAPGLTSIDRLGFENRIKALTIRIQDNQRALGAASRDIIIYTGEIGKLNAANIAQAENFSKLFPELRENILLFQALTLVNLELRDSILAIQDAGTVADILARTTAQVEAFSLGPERAKPFPSVANKEDIAAEKRDRAQVIRDRNRSVAEKRRLRFLKEREKLQDRQEKQRQRDEAKRTADEKSRQARRDRLERQRLEEAAEITKTLDVISVGLSFIDTQMASLVSRAADFAEALATGDIFAKLGAGIGLVGTLLGLRSDRGESQADIFNREQRQQEKELIEQQRELVAANKEVSAAIDRWIDEIQLRTLGETKEQRDLFQLLNDLLRQAAQDAGRSSFFGELDQRDPGDFGPDISDESFIAAFNQFIQQLLDTGFELPPGFTDAEDILEAARLGGGLARNLFLLLQDLIGISGLPQRILDEAIAAETLEQMLDVLRDLQKNGQLTLASGQDLLSFWKSFQNLSLEQEKELLENLLNTLRASGDITPGSILDLLAALETLEEAIQAEKDEEEASGLTQIQRSVTTITEGQANIIAATLNSILSILGLMDTRLAQIVTGLIGTESGGLLSGVGAPLATIPEFGFELPEVLASLLGIEEKLGSFLDRVAANIGPTITVQSGAIIINQNFPAITERIEVEEITSSAITEAIIASGRAEGIKV